MPDTSDAARASVPSKSVVRWHTVFDGSLHKVGISRWCNRDTSRLPSKNNSNGISRLRTGKQIWSAVVGLCEP